MVNPIKLDVFRCVRKLIKPRANKIVKQKMLAYRVITDWNSLPEAIVMAESINIFKNKLEQILVKC